jgi:hypothetical protein
VKSDIVSLILQIMNAFDANYCENIREVVSSFYSLRNILMNLSLLSMYSTASM